jgi:histidinol phosphatase-like PHP family hydrolase
MRSQPFILAMQAEGREWVTTFSQRVRDEFDFVFTDAMTFTDHKGRRSRLWIPQETHIDNEQQYMDLIVDRICSVLQEPMDVYVNPCFLPDRMQDRYDAFWTEDRQVKFINALVKSGKALEINNRYQIPNKAIIQKAKAAGVKFTFGTNNAGANDMGKMEYAIRIKEECGLTAQDMYKPKIKI